MVLIYFKEFSSRSASDIMALLVDGKVFVIKDVVRGQARDGMICINTKSSLMENQ